MSDRPIPKVGDIVRWHYTYGDDDRDSSHPLLVLDWGYNNGEIKEEYVTLLNLATGSIDSDSWVLIPSTKWQHGYWEIMA